MRHFLRNLLLTASCITVISCSEIEEIAPQISDIAVFKAVMDDSKAVSSEGKVLFQEGETIDLIDSDLKERICTVTLSSTDIKEGGKEAHFTADISGHTNILALYPALGPEAGNLTANGFVFQPEKTKGLSSAVCTAPENIFHFSNITSFISFNLDGCPESMKGFSSVNIKACGSGNFLGKDVVINPVTGLVSGGENVKEIHYNAEDGDCRIAVMPGSDLPEGFSVELSYDGGTSQAIFSAQKAFAVNLNEYISLGSIFWKNLGEGLFYDTFLLGENPAHVSVKISRYTPRVVAISNPYAGISTESDLASKEMQITLLDGGYVSFSDCNTGHKDISYGEVITVKYPSGGYTSQNRIDYMQSEACPGQIQLAPIYYMEESGYWDMSHEEGCCVLVFPGMELRKYDVNLENPGIHENEGKVYFDAGIKLDNGTEEVRYTVEYNLTDSMLETVQYNLIHGIGDYVSISVDSHCKWDISDNPAGDYTLVYVALSAGKDPRTHSLKLTRPDFNNMQSLGYCLYTDDLISSVFPGINPVSYRVELLSNKAKEGIFYLKNPYGAAYPNNNPSFYDSSVDFYIEIDASNESNVTIKRQPMGCNRGYGDMMVASAEAEGQIIGGTLSGNIISFPKKGLTVGMEGTGIWYGNIHQALAIDMTDLRPAPSAAPSAKSAAVYLPSAYHPDFKSRIRPEITKHNK